MISRDAERRQFCQRFFGKTEIVFHELPVVSAAIHVDLFRRTPKSSLLVTNGFSDYFMQVPEGHTLEQRRVELILYTPLLKAKVYETDLPWQADLIRGLAHLMVERQSFCCTGLAAPLFAEGIRPGSKLTCAFFLPPMFEEAAFEKGVTTSDGTHVDYLMLDFLTEAEFQHRLAHGAAAMFDVFEKNRHQPVLEPGRPSYV